jgi:YidC/Oxa1 family membrane protein insertase
VLAFNFFEPITQAMLGLLNAIHSVVPSYGLTMILLALIVRVALFPLAQQQFKSMAEMQKVQPLLKELQAKHKGKPQELQAATMALYKEHGVNPLAGCFPMLIQLPVLLGLFYAINSQLGEFGKQGFLWIGTPLSHQFPDIFATSLATLDMPLFVLYVVSMYISVRFGSPPSTDPQQAQTQKIMAVVSPVMIAYFGWKYKWASALLIYWFSLNVFTMAQQLWMYRRYGLWGAKTATAAAALAIEAAPDAAAGGKNGTARKTTPASKNGSTSGRAQRRSKR